MEFTRFRQLLEQLVPAKGLYQSTLEPVMLFKETQSQGRIPWVYEPAVIIAASGHKNIYLDGNCYHYSAGHFMALFMPMAVECEMVGISESTPMLGLAVRLDRQRLAKLVLKMENADKRAAAVTSPDTSGIFSAPLKANMLEVVIRLLQTLQDPLATAVLGDALIDELYYRLLTEEQGGQLRVLLQQQGQIQQISKAVEHLHENLEKNVSVEELASMTNMSSSGFHKKFKEVMHISPVQYVKAIRLNRARNLILEGRNVSEAGYSVGYNSPAQFSREYKRQFGISPSQVRR